MNELSPIEFSIPFDTINQDVEEIGYYRCYYESNGNLKTDGLSVKQIDLDNHAIICQTTHFTDFILGIPGLSMDDTPVIPIVNQTTFGSYRVVVSSSFWFILVISVLFVILGIWGTWKDKNQSTNMHKIKKITNDLKLSAL